MTVNLLKRDPKVYWNPYIAGGILGVVLFGAFFLSGEGLGASGGVAHTVAALTDLVAPDYVDNSPALVGWAGGDKNPLDHHIVYMAIGVIIGGLLSGLLRGRVKLETRKGPRISVRTRWVLAFVGGTMAGFAARLARGCTSGQGLSGISTMSWGSWIFLLAMFGVGYVIAYPIRKLWI